MIHRILNFILFDKIIYNFGVEGSPPPSVYVHGHSSTQVFFFKYKLNFLILYKHF